MSYAFPPGGLPDQSEHPDGTAIFTESYAVLPAVTQRDIVTSFLPEWTGTRVWILARPLSGFAETFAQYAVEIAPGGGSDAPEPDPSAQAILFVAEGEAALTVDGTGYGLKPGSYAYIAPGVSWTLRNEGSTLFKCHWVRKAYQPAKNLETPRSFVTSDQSVAPTPMPDCNGFWATTRFVDLADLRHDCHVNIVTFQPGGRIPFAETHVMEHGLYVLQGTAEYLLNKDWVSVGPGDFMWLRAFCPQACIATGSEPFRYLLYKDVNRHVRL
ncbi:MAG: bifunctional allantoicase/(S)-ureidoglycine aminohydrolase [Pseudomonadota bacterium]